MSVIGTLKVSTDPLGKLLGRKQAVGFDHLALAMNPFGFNGVEPGALGGQQERQNAYAFSLLLNLLVVLTDPGPYSQTFVPGSVIPNEQPGRLALLLQ